MISSFYGMISSFHGMIPSFHGMISSFHAVFVLRHRDKSTKVIDYNDQVIRVRGYLLFRGISSLMFLLLSHFLLYLCGASFQGYGHKKNSRTNAPEQNHFFAFPMWCHQEMSFISKWLYIFALKNRDERNLPLLLHLNSAPFCSVSQSLVPTLMQRYIIIVIYKWELQSYFFIRK